MLGSVVYLYSYVRGINLFRGNINIIFGSFVGQVRSLLKGEITKHDEEPKSNVHSGKIDTYFFSSDLTGYL